MLIGIVNIDGPLWKMHRRFAVRRMRDVGVGQVTLDRTLQQESNRLQCRLLATNGTPVQPDGFINESLIRVILWVVMGESEMNNEFKEAMEKINESMKYSASLCRLPIPMFFK